LAFQHFEAVLSVIDIAMVAIDDSRVVELCKLHGVEPGLAVSPFYMQWEGESDWDEEAPPVKGETILVPVLESADGPSNGRSGQLLRSQGYAEEMAAIGQFRFTDDDVFVLETPYDRAAAEERIWFVNPKLRMRVSMIKTSGGSGVVTASFASEIRV
jgi:phycoerythrin-associated linker protein